jgi:hypothetical protein
MDCPSKKSVSNVRDASYELQRVKRTASGVGIYFGRIAPDRLSCLQRRRSAKMSFSSAPYSLVINFFFATLPLFLAGVKYRHSA